ncbi:hypothetical protein EB093_01610 [bacterium]|nr:hypothetical protein [bacterium]
MMNTPKGSTHKLMAWLGLSIMLTITGCGTATSLSSETTMSIAERQEILNAVSQALNDSNMRYSSQYAEPTPNERLWFWKGDSKSLGTTTNIGMDGKTRTYDGWVETLFNSVTPSITVEVESWNDYSGSTYDDTFRTYKYPNFTEQKHEIQSKQSSPSSNVTYNYTTNFTRVFKSGDVISVENGTFKNGMLSYPFHIDITVHEKRYHLTCQFTADSTSASGNIYSVEGVRIGSLIGGKDNKITTSVD